MEATPARKPMQANGAQETPLPPGTLKLFNTPYTNTGNTGNTRNSRGTKRNRNNASYTSSTITPYSKLLRADAIERLIITDYNPNEVNQITEDGHIEKLIISKINNIENFDKYFFYPSSFVFKFEEERGARKLCIHKFSHNDPISITYSPTYVLHPNLIKLLRKQGLASSDIKNIIYAFKSINQEQTLLINLRFPVKIKSAIKDTIVENFEINHTTPVNISYSGNNTASVIVYNPETKYGSNNNRAKNNNSNFSLHSRGLTENRNKLTGSELEYYDRYIGDKPGNTIDMTENFDENVIEVVFGYDNGSGWHPSMATPPAAGMNIDEPPQLAIGTPGTPTQLAIGTPGTPTQLATGTPTGTPTQLATGTPTGTPTQLATGTPTQLATGTPTGTPIDTQMLYGGRLKKNNKTNKKHKNYKNTTKKNKKTKKSKKTNKTIH